jgi:nicotinamidase-related amidase
MVTLENCALVVIDVQGNLAHAMDGKEALFTNLGKIISGMKILGVPIIWTEQVPAKLGKTIPEIAQALEGLTPVEKTSFSCFGNERFARDVAATGRTHFIVCGIEAHVCVYQTVRDFLAAGYNVEVVVDAVCSRHERDKAIGVEKMKHLGAQITSVETALFELMATAESAKFRQIQKIVK